MSGRQPRLHSALRICAAGCAVLWLMGVAACDLERLLESCHHPSPEGHDHPHNVVAAHDQSDSRNAADAHNESHHSPDAEGHSRDSHHHDGKDDRCCSTLQAIVQTAKPIIIAKSVLPPISLLCVLLEAHASALIAGDRASDRPPSCREWTFTPEVSLGPAFRSLAPPVRLI